MTCLSPGTAGLKLLSRSPRWVGFRQRAAKLSTPSLLSSSRPFSQDCVFPPQKNPSCKPRVAAAAVILKLPAVISPKAKHTRHFRALRSEHFIASRVAFFGSCNPMPENNGQASAEGI